MGENLDFTAVKTAAAVALTAHQLSSPSSDAFIARHETNDQSVNADAVNGPQNIPVRVLPDKGLDRIILTLGPVPVSIAVGFHSIRV